LPSALCASWLLPSAVKCPTPQALRPEAGARASCARQRLFPQRSCLLCVRVNLTCFCASAMCAGLVLAIGVGLIGIGLREPTLYVCLMCVLGYWICAGDWRPIDRYRVCARLRRVQGLGLRVEGLGFSFFRVWALGFTAWVARPGVCAPALGAWVRGWIPCACICTCSDCDLFECVVGAVMLRGPCLRVRARCCRQGARSDILTPQPKPPLNLNRQP
jgi:hypothetical protein